MRLLHSVPSTNGSLTFFLPKGQYGSIMIEYDLDAALGVTLTRAQMGNIILNWNGDNVINVDAEILNLLDNVYGGTAEFSAAVGGATRMSVFIPLAQWFDSLNVYDIGEKDQVYIKLDFPTIALATNVDSGSVRVYAKNKVGVMNYLHKIISRSVVSAGATTIADTYPVNNISQLYLKNPAALVSNIQITKDNDTVVDAPTAVLNAYSDWIHLLESTNTTIVIEFGESKDIRENVGSQISYKYTFTGAGTLAQYFSYIEFTPIKAIESRAKAGQKLARQSNAAALGNL